ncbi:serine/threonine-protein kinase [bacterium]|nr:serine/threonine-protein kinase [bacterium]
MINKHLLNHLVKSISLITVINKNNMTYHKCDFSDSKYIYQYKLGSGMYGNVFKCKKINSQLDCAIKIISKSENDIIVKQEINILQQLQKIKYNYSLLDYYQDNYYYYIVTNYISGITLYTYLQRVKKISEEKSIQIIKQLINQLMILKDNNIIHNDIKLDNIIINIQSFNVTLIDFGSSNYIDKTINYNTTLEYSPPEFLNNKIISYQNDIWALGCLFYILLTGKHPFDNNDSNNILNNITNIDFNKHYLVNVSEKTKYIITKMLKKNPSSRITIEELYEFFNSYI